jgi:hypothetical protein
VIGRQRLYAEHAERCAGDDAIMQDLDERLPVE